MAILTGLVLMDAWRCINTILQAIIGQLSVILALVAMLQIWHASNWVSQEHPNMEELVHLGEWFACLMLLKVNNIKNVETLYIRASFSTTHTGFLLLNYSVKPVPMQLVITRARKRAG